MRHLVTILLVLISILPLNAEDLTRVAGRVVGQTLDNSWSKGWVATTDAYTSLLHVEKAKPSYLILVGEGRENRDLQVRYWVLPTIDRPELLKEALNREFDYHFADYPTGLLHLDGRKVPLLNKGLDEKFEVSFRPSYEGASPVETWVAFGGEGFTMTLHQEQANSEVGQMASLVLEAAKQHHTNQAHWYRRISPLWGWGAAVALLVCLVAFLIFSRKRH